MEAGRSKAYPLRGSKNFHPHRTHSQRRRPLAPLTARAKLRQHHLRPSTRIQPQTPRLNARKTLHQQTTVTDTYVRNVFGDAPQIPHTPNFNPYSLPPTPLSFENTDSHAQFFCPLPPPSFKIPISVQSIAIESVDPRFLAPACLRHYLQYCQPRCALAIV